MSITEQWFTSFNIHYVHENYIMSPHKLASKLPPDRASVVDHLLDCLKALPLVWDVEGLKDVREGGIVTTDPSDWSL